MTTHTAPAATATTALSGRTMPTKYPDKACHFCASMPTAWATLLPSGWVSVCSACSVSHKAQVLGLYNRLNDLSIALGEQATAAMSAAITPQVETLVSDALDAESDASTAARTVVPILLAIAALGEQFRPVPVRPNRYRGTCADCGTNVAEGVGRIEQVDGQWVTHHLAGGCPVIEAAPVAAAPVIEAAPLAASEASRCIGNRKAGKCVSCGTKVAVGAGFAMQNLPDGPRGGWSVLHTACADSLAADRLGLPTALRALGDRIIAATGTDTRDHAVRLCVDFVVGDGDGNQSHVFLRACWGATPGIEVHTGHPGSVRRSPVGARRAARIAANLLALSDAALGKAQTDYGTKMHACGRCGSPLTDDTSRTAGIGPECAKKV